MERLEIYFYCCRSVFSDGILLRSDGLLSKIFIIFWSMLKTGESRVDISGGDLPRPLCGSSPMPPKAPLPCSWCALTPQKSRPRLLQCIWADHHATSSYALLPKATTYLYLELFILSLWRLTFLKALARERTLSGLISTSSFFGAMSRVYETVGNWDITL